MVHHVITRSKKNGHPMITRSKKKILVIPLTTRIKKKNNVIPIRKKTLVPKRRLPNDIINEILSWLPVRSLVRFKGGCKQWRALFEDRYFIDKHYRKASFCGGYCEPEIKTRDTMEWLLYCNGLFLERHKLSKKYRIKNPAMHQVFDLPDAHERSVSVTFCHVPASGCYKAVSLYCCNGETSYGGIEVLTLGSEDEPAWRSINTTHLCDYDKNKEKVWLLPIPGAVHFIRKSKVKIEYEVLSLDLETECITSSTVPSSFVVDKWSRLWFIRWDSYLSCALLVKNDLHVLLLEDYKKGKWSEKKLLFPLKFLTENPDIHDEVVIRAGKKKLIQFRRNNGHIDQVYDAESGKIVMDMKVKVNGKPVALIGPCSLATFKGMKPEKKNETQKKG